MPFILAMKIIQNSSGKHSRILERNHHNDHGKIKIDLFLHGENALSADSYEKCIAVILKVVLWYILYFLNQI